MFQFEYFRMVIEFRGVLATCRYFGLINEITTIPTDAFILSPFVKLTINHEASPAEGFGTRSLSSDELAIEPWTGVVHVLLLEARMHHA